MILFTEPKRHNVVGILLAAVLLVAAPGFAAKADDTEGAEGEAPAPSIIGIWKMVEYHDREADGSERDTMGASPAGVFVYSPGGRLSLHVARLEGRTPFGADTSDTERGAAARGYIGYFGTYKVDYERMTVTHIIEGALAPNRIGGAFERPFKLDGDTLTLEFTNPDGRSYFRRLERVERFIVED